MLAESQRPVAAMFPNIADSGLNFQVVARVAAHQSEPPLRKSLRSRTLGTLPHRRFAVPVHCDLRTRRLLKGCQGGAPALQVQFRSSCIAEILPQRPRQGGAD